MYSLAVEGLHFPQSYQCLFRPPIALSLRQSHCNFEQPSTARREQPSLLAFHYQERLAPKAIKPVRSALINFMALLLITLTIKFAVV